MASIRFSAVGGEIKGKINGTVFQGGKSGPIVKRLIHRSFVRILALLYGAIGTTYSWAGSMASDESAEACIVYADGSHLAKNTDTNQRVLLASIASSWRNLTEEQITAWNAAAVNFPFKNRFGDTYTGSGFQVYQQLNLNLSKVGVATLTWPPAPDAPILPSILYPDPTIEYTVVDTGDTITAPLNVSFPDGIPANQRIMVFSAPGQSPGQTSKFKNPKLFAVLAPSESAVSYDLSYMWETFFGKLNANTKISLRFVAINTDTGESSINMTKAELIDAIASGSKLTKADAGLAFPDTDTGEEVVEDTTIKAVNIPATSFFNVTGANAAEFNISYDEAGPFDYTLQADVDGFGNLVPRKIYVQWVAGVAGAKVAALNLRNGTDPAMISVALTGTATTP